MRLRNHRTQQNHQAATLAWNSQSLRALSTICDTEGKLLRFVMEQVFLLQFTQTVVNKTFRLFSYGMIATLGKEHIYITILKKNGVFLSMDDHLRIDFYQSSLMNWPGNISRLGLSLRTLQHSAHRAWANGKPAIFRGACIMGPSWGPRVKTSRTFSDLSLKKVITFSVGSSLGKVRLGLLGKHDLS